MKSDQVIRDNVLEEIRLDPKLASIAANIGVAVNNEVVTLSGEVDYYYQRIAAENAAQRIAGVKVVAVDIEVRGAEISETKSDTQIAEAIRNALTWHSAVNEDLINIKVDDGKVYLEGMVTWDYERKAAEKVIENIIGVKAVFNNVKIKTKAVEPQEVKRNIRAAFHRSATVDAANIDVDVRGTKVILEGKVRSWAEKTDAENVARSIPGITDIDNRLEIDTAVLASEGITK
jgi:osmotically-inducible protein OsmY